MCVMKELIDERGGMTKFITATFTDDHFPNPFIVVLQFLSCQSNSYEYVE